MGQVVKFPGRKVGPSHIDELECKAFLRGFAAGVCDGWRAGDGPQALLDSGITFEEFKGVYDDEDEYDLETLEEMFACT